MSLVVLLLGMGILMGAAAHTSLTVFTVAAAAIAVWLVGFAVRERLAQPTLNRLANAPPDRRRTEPPTGTHRQFPKGTP